MGTLASTPFAVLTPQLKQKYAFSGRSVPQLEQNTNVVTCTTKEYELLKNHAQRVISLWLISGV
jgi:hypothetical protein